MVILAYAGVYPYAVEEVSAPASSALGDVTRLRTALGIASTDAVATSELTTALAASTAQIQAYCGRVFGNRDMRYHWRAARGIGAVVIPDLPLIRIAHIIDKTTGVAIAVKPGIGGVLYRDFPHHGDDLECEAEVGYTLPGVPNPTLPEDLQQASIDLAREIYLRRSRSADVASESLAGISDLAFAPTAIPLAVRILIDPYRRMEL